MYRCIILSGRTSPQRSPSALISHRRRRGRSALPRPPESVPPQETSPIASATAAGRPRQRGCLSNSDSGDATNEQQHQEDAGRNHRTKAHAVFQRSVALSCAQLRYLSPTPGIALIRQFEKPEHAVGGRGGCNIYTCSMHIHRYIDTYMRKRIIVVRPYC